MPRFKPVDQGLQLLAVDLSLQLHPGSFEYALHDLIEHEIDLSQIEARYRNEEQGAWAYDPRVLLKIVLLSYSRGIISSRSMEGGLLPGRGLHGPLGQQRPALQHAGQLREQLRGCDRQALRAGAHHLRS